MGKSYFLECPGTFILGMPKEESTAWPECFSAHLQTIPEAWDAGIRVGRNKGRSGILQTGPLLSRNLVEFWQILRFNSLESSSSGWSDGTVLKSLGFGARGSCFSPSSDANESLLCDYGQVTFPSCGLL